MQISYYCLCLRFHQYLRVGLTEEISILSVGGWGGEEGERIHKNLNRPASCKEWSNALISSLRYKSSRDAPRSSEPPRRETAARGRSQSSWPLVLCVSLGYAALPTGTESLLHRRASPGKRTSVHPCARDRNLEVILTFLSLYSLC